MTYWLKEFPRPLPKGSLVEFAGERAKVVRDDGSTIKVIQAGQHMTWHWTFQGETVKVLRLPVFTLTPKRLAALKLIRDVPGCYVSHVAQSVLGDDYRRTVLHGFSAQQATRAGAAYCQALEAAGLVKINRHTDCGYGTVTLTPAGEAALA